MKTMSLHLLLTALVIFLLPGPGLASEARLRASDLAETDTLKSDITAEVQFGKHLAARILANHPLIDDPTTQYYVNLVGSAVALSAGRPELDFYFGVLESDQVNAFAVPGGYIFITQAAMALMQNEAELAGVLGHEIGHIVAKHMVKELNIRGENGSTMAGLSAIIGGTTASFRQALDQTLENAVNILYRRGYKTADELEADQIGIMLAAFSGYDPSGLQNYILRIKHFETHTGDHDGEHPSHKVRAEAISKALEASGVNPITYSKGEKRFNETLAK